MKQNAYVRNDGAVTEILGTMLLLIIALIIFSTVYFSVLSMPQKSMPPNANIAFSFDATNITLSHLSGLALDPNSIISISIDDTTYSRKISEFTSWDENDDNTWGFGETLTFNPSESELLSKNITVSIIDEHSNSLVLFGNYYQPPTYIPSVRTTVNNLSFFQSGPTVDISAAGDILLTNVSLYYRYSTDGTSWNEYTFFANDSQHPWEWAFDFPQSFGWYEFYSIGYYKSKNENPPSTADTACLYTLAPVINNPYPSSGATGVELNPTLQITITDKDNGDENVMDLTWFSNATGSWQQISSNNNIGNGTYLFDSTGLMSDHETTYYWNVSVTDGTHTVDSAIFSFTTIGLNTPPNEPSNPSPSHQSTDIPIDSDLSWTGGDADGDLVTYDVYFGTSSPPSKIVNNQSETSYDPGSLNSGETYYWKIVSWDEHDISSEGPIWEFTTEDIQIITTSFSPSKDSYIREESNSNYGDEEFIRVGFSYIRRGLISFDITSIDGKTIISAELKVYKFYDYYYCDDSDPVGRTYNVHRILENWNENSVRWNNRPNYDNSITDSDIVPDDDNWMIWNVTDDVQYFANGFTNYGWVIKDNEEEDCYSCSYFRSRDYSDSDYWPVLEVTYID
jgi:hypothetical protein